MTCCVSPTGNVYPCAFLQEEPFCVGNIRHDGFQDLWDNAPVFQNLRSLHVSTCMNCDRFDVCRGGCPAMAYHTYRRIDMPDPECLVNLKKLAS
jgi:radical SAM protein with 4Fe4S-binding SPASM domain